MMTMVCSWVTSRGRSSATEHAGKKIAFACCDADMRYSTCTRADADGEVLRGEPEVAIDFATKDSTKTGERVRPNRARSSVASSSRAQTGVLLQQTLPVDGPGVPGRRRGPAGRVRVGVIPFLRFPSLDCNSPLIGSREQGRRRRDIAICGSERVIQSPPDRKLAVCKALAACRDALRSTHASVHTRALCSLSYMLSPKHADSHALVARQACRHIFSGAARDTTGLPNNIVSI